MFRLGSGWTLLRGSPCTPALICAVFLAVVAVPLVFYTVHTLNYHKENTRIEENASTVTHDIGERIAEIRTLIASLVGLHYASTNLEDNEFILFSRELREQAEYVTGIGRYEQIQTEDRADFESSMSEKGLFDFRITEIDSNGRSQTRSESPRYYPISMLEPMRPDNLKLLGADLGTVDGLNDMLDTITSRNESLIATFPKDWPANGDLVLFRPVYLGKRAPTNSAARQQQAAGGYWVSIDIEALLAAVSSQISAFDVTVDILSEGETTTIHSQLGQNEKTIYLESLYPRKRFTEEWPTATTSLIVTLKHDIGYSKVTIGYLLATIISIVLITGLYATYATLRRKAMTDQQASKDALFEEREKAEKTLNSVQDAIITLDANMRVVHINPAAVIQFNAKPNATIGRSLSNIVQFQLAGESYGIFNVETALSNLSANSRGEFDVVPVGHDHDEFVIRLTLTSSYNFEGAATGHVLVMRDISQERRLTRKLAYQANHDALTGCTNRYHFEQTLAGLIDELAFKDTSHALCYMDLDQFKVINDTCGHRAGDRLLTELTGNMKMIIKDGDILSRLGGDEFGLLMLNVDQKETLKVSQRIFEFFQKYVFHHEDKAFAVRASIGIVHIDQTCNNMKDVLAAADIACYAAKDAGRNSMYVYSETDDTMTERSVELSWLPRLQNALQNDEFRLHVQAVASLDALPEENAIEHFEFLLRLSNTAGADSTPWQFIQAAERYDLMRDIDRWVIRNALRTVAELKGGPGGACSFSINLSGQSAADPTLKDFIREQIIDYQVDPSQIWFELTETAAISHFSIAVDLIKSIRSFGSKVALDDFGSGLSSFGYLKNLPVDIIKIDGQFVKEIANNPIDREMVRAIHQVGRSMGIATVAEFVENQAIVEVLREIGIDYAQGYHIGKPCDVQTAVSLLPSNLKNVA